LMGKETVDVHTRVIGTSPLSRLVVAGQHVVDSGVLTVL
jgi:hypothetical protein